MIVDDFTNDGVRALDVKVLREKEIPLWSAVYAAEYAMRRAEIRSMRFSADFEEEDRSIAARRAAVREANIAIVRLRVAEGFWSP